MILIAIASFALAKAGPAPSQTSENLALRAKPSAFEFFEDFRPEKANDGKLDTRWSGVPGHNSGAWYQLEWPSPVQVGEVIVRQFERFTVELDVQIWDLAKNAWVTKKHYGRPGIRLHDTVICRFEQLKTTKVRIGNCTNGPSFREVEVYAEAFSTYKPEVHAASDLRGNIVGVVTDPWGAEPVAGARIQVETVSSEKHEGDPYRFTHAVTADKNGMFSVPMPVGMRDKVTFKVDGPSSRAKNMLEVNAADFQYGLTELGYKPKVTILDGSWKFMGDPSPGFEKPGFEDSTWKDIKVPSHWEMEGYVVRSGHGGYRRKFTVPENPGAKKGRLKIRFDGVYSGCAVYCNGTLVARHTGGATPFEADLTDVVHEGENVLAVDVQEHTVASEHLDKMSKHAYFHLSGIWRSVYLFEVPAVHFGQTEVWTDLQANEGKGSFHIKTRIVNESGQKVVTSPDAILTDDHPFVPKDELIKPPIDYFSDERSVEIDPWGTKEVSWEFPVLKTWNAEQPTLYTLVLAIGGKGDHPYVIRQRVGFRQTTISGTQILINGTPVKFKGVCHHDQDPLKGRAVSEEDTRKDLELMKEANLNAVRTSHYPPHPSLPEIADELGLYVEAEAPFCWADCSQDVRNAPLILQLTAETIQRDRNHPSVVWWSMANESEYGWGFERALEWATKADPSRPHSAATSAQPSDVKGLDIYTLHNPIAIDRIQESEKLDKPLIFDESFCIFQGIWNDVAEMWVDPGIRDYWIEPLKPIYEAFMKSKVTQGSFIWAWSDDIFCVPNRGLEYGRETTRSHFLESSYLVPGRGLVGDAPWGVVDGWRRKKPEFWHLRNLHSPLKIVEKQPQDSPNLEIDVDIRNEFSFLDLKDLRIQWISQGKTATAVATGAPGTVGTVHIKGYEPPFSNTQLLFSDAGGRPVAEFVLGAELGLDSAPKPTPPPRLLQVFDSSDLSGNSLHIAGQGFELAFSRDGGYLRQCVVNGKPLLLEFPLIHLLPTNDPLGPLPKRTSWRFEGLEHRPMAPDLEKTPPAEIVTIKGSYEDLKGGYQWIVASSGEIIVHSEFTYSGSDRWVREAGLRFSVPLKANWLEWISLGEWTVYPGDHIGRSRGVTSTEFRGGDGGEPVWEWFEDWSPMGPNDFRSTKRRIKTASIGFGETSYFVPRPWPKIEILSDGTQHLRAMVESDRISVHVNDFYGGTGAGLWEWEHNYGKGKLIKKGDVLKSRLRLRLVGDSSGASDCGGPGPL